MPEPEARPQPPQSIVDQETGLSATHYDGGVWFKSGDRYFSAPSVTAGLEHDPSASLATPQEVTQRLTFKAQDNFGGAVKTAAKQFTSHAIDAATAAYRYPAMAIAALTDDQKGLNELQDLSGEKVLENLYAAHSQMNEVRHNPNLSPAERERLTREPGQQFTEAGKSYHDATAAQVQANPDTALVAGIAGDLAPAIASGGATLSAPVAEATAGRLGTGALARAGEHALTGAIQGAGFGMQAASEESYLDDDPLTRQKIWAAGSMGGLFGGAISGGISLAGSGVAKVFRPKLTQTLGPVEVAPKSSLAEAIGDSNVSKEAAQAVADKAMAEEGVEAAPGLGSKLHSLLTDVQASATGAEKEAVSKYGLGAILDPKSRVAALDGIRIFRERPQIIEGASSEIADSMRTLQEHADNGVFQEVRDLGMKRNAWEKLVEPTKRGEQVDAARSFLADTREKLETMLTKAPPAAAEAVEALPDGTGFEAAATSANEVAARSGHLEQVQDFLNKSRRKVSEAERAGETGRVSKGVSEFLHEAQKAGATYEGLVYRGTNEAELDSILKTGRADHTLSVSQDLDGAMHFAKKGNVLLEIKDHPVPVDGIEGSNTFSEALIPKGEEARIIGQRVENGVKVVTIEMGPKAASAATDIAEEATAYGELKRIKSLLGHVKKAEKSLAGDVSGADAAIELDAFKRNLGKNIEGVKRKHLTLRMAGDFDAEAVRNTGVILHDTNERLRQHLMNEGLWGKAGTAQREINQGWVDWLDSQRVYNRTLATNTGKKGGGDFARDFATQERYEIDPNKVGGWIDQFGTGRGKLNDKYIQAHIDATDKLTSTIGKFVDTGTTAESVAKVRDAVQKIQSQLKVARETVAVANQVQLVGGAQMSAATKLGLGAAGAMLGGPLGGAVGAAAGFLLNPGKVMQAAMALQGLASKVDVEKAGLIKDFFAKAGRTVRKGQAAAEDLAFTEGMNNSGAVSAPTPDEGIGKRAAKRAATAFGGAFGASESPNARAETYAKRRSQLALLTSSPELLAHQTQSVLGALPGIAPKLATSLSLDMTRNLMALQRMAPPASPIAGLFAGKRHAFTPQSDIDKFAHQWDGVMNPLSVLKDLNKGSLNVDKVEAARAAHPELFAEIASDFFEHAAKMKEPMSRQAALQADLLLGLNGAGEPSVSPGFLSRIAALNQADAQDQKSPPSPRPPVNMAKGVQTLSQSLQGP